MLHNINDCFNDLNISWSSKNINYDINELNSSDNIFFEELRNLLDLLNLNNEELMRFNVIVHEYLSEHPVRKRLIEAVYVKESQKPIVMEAVKNFKVPHLPIDDSIVRKIDICEDRPLYQPEKVKKFGGINKLKNAIKTNSLDDVYCWENGKWYTQRYWSEVVDKTLTGISLSELLEKTPLDATHFSGPLFNKMDESGHVYEWIPQQKRWLYVGWHPNASIEPLD